MNVLIAVTHLLGAGHLSRALTLARAFAVAGHRVTLASGGMPMPQFDSTGVTIRQLPPLRSDGTDFTRLLTADGTVADVGYLAARRRSLTLAVTETRPDIVITELFPFGRRVLQDEFYALLRAARGRIPKPVILASIRDILAPPSKPEKAQHTAHIIDDYYDGVLVHSDPNRIPLDKSWPVSPALDAKLRYTGYVSPPPAGPHPDELGKGEVIVSAGGGPVGEHLFNAAIAVAQRSSGVRWRILVGGYDPAPLVKRLKMQRGGADIIIEPARPDFRQMLYHAAASISMCGYNTALDLMQAGTPALFIPFDEAGEVEQTLRAENLSQMPRMRMIRAGDLTPEHLLKEVAALVQLPRKGATNIRLDGAAETVRIAVKMAQARR
ncbi:MAG: glycosyltransferase [Marinosulfonomonas sp.]|nr:glycosyltransferase [Marinosulfonomonas sp.]